MADIFISYPKQEQALTRAVAAFLVSHGYTVWWDTDLTAGEEFRDVIDRELDAAKAVIVIWSRQSVTSRWVIAEADHADRDRKLIPLRTKDLDPRSIPKPYSTYHTEVVDDREAILKAVGRFIVRESTTAITTGFGRLAVSTGERDGEQAQHVERPKNTRDIFPGSISKPQSRRWLHGWFVAAAGFLLLAAAVWWNVTPPAAEQESSPKPKDLASTAAEPPQSVVNPAAPAVEPPPTVASPAVPASPVGDDTVKDSDGPVNGATDIDVGARADTLNDALVNTYKNNRQFNAQRRRQTQSNTSAARETLRGAEQTVLLKAATTYMEVLRDGALLELQHRNVEALQEELRETRDRFTVGEVTNTEVAQTEARLAQGRTTELSAESQYASSRANYHEVTGTEAGALQPGTPADGLTPKTLVQAIEMARARHPSVGAAVFAIDSAGRPVRGQGNEAVLQKCMELGAVRDQVQAGVVTAWGRLETARTQIVSTLAQVRSSETALDGVREESRIGQRTTSDIFSAQQQLANARIALVTAQHDRVVASFALLSAVGDLNLPKLGRNVSGYPPMVNDRQMRDASARVESRCSPNVARRNRG